MYDELTQVDIQKMQEELDYRTGTLRWQLLEEVKLARSHGDLSENFEYKEAKRQRNRNEGRIRYLQKMIKTANVVAPEHAEGQVGLFDFVELELPEEGEESETMRVQLVTGLRIDADEGRISKDSPLGRAIFGRTVGEHAMVEVSDEVRYEVIIRAIEKGEDDASLPIARF